MTFVLPGDVCHGLAGEHTIMIDNKVVATTKGKVSYEGDICHIINGGIAVPKLNDVVIGICKFITRKTAHVEIVLITRRIGLETIEIPVNEEYKGMIRHVDVQEIERDSVVISDKIRVGDIVRACVISFGENAVYLSTAHRYLGVVYAMKNGEIMKVVAKDKVECSSSGSIESRKMAIVEK